MQGEQTTLWTFGGGIDPSISDLEEKDVVHTREQLVVTGGDQTITDLGVRLERDLVERLDPRLLKTGAERRQLRMQPQQADWADAMYIRAEPTDETRTFDRAVMQYDGYPTVGIPRALLRNDVVNGIDNPFHTAGPEDHVVVRYLPEGAIEIYPEEVFNTHPEFTRLRATSPFIVVSPDDSKEIDCYNLAAATPYDGQLFEIVPFNQNTLEGYFQKENDEKISGSQEAQPTADEFTRILTAENITPCSAPFLQIHWGTESTSLDETVRLQLEETERFRVVLPAYGLIWIDGSPTVPSWISMLIHKSYEHKITDSAVEDSVLTVFDESGHINGKYTDRINEHWRGHFFEVPEQGPPIIYIPTDPEQDTFSEPINRLASTFEFIDH